MPAALRRGAKSLALLLALVTFTYLVTLVLMMARGALVFNNARSTYQAYENEGFTSRVEKQYLSLLSHVDNVAKDLETSLLAPLADLIGQSQRVNQALAAYEYSKDALPVLPHLIGMKNTQKYLVAFQNPAEARGTGGIIGAFAIVTIKQGKFSVEQVGTNAVLQSLEEIPIQMPEEFVRIYRSDPAIWQNSNLSPHFPYAGQIWLALWREQFGQDLNGVITLDPIVLSHILAMTGPINVQGKEISSDNVVEETLSQAYLRFESDNLARKQYLVEIIKGVAERIEQSSLSPTALIDNMVVPLLQHRILVYNSDVQIEKVLSLSPLSGALSLMPSNEFRLVIQNTAGNKMDYYIERQLVLTSRSCRNKKITQVEFTIKNSALEDAYLPSYVSGRLDLDLPQGKNNSTSVTVFLYGPPGAKLITAMDALTGGASGFVKKERSRQALVIPLELKAGESRSFIADFKGGTGPISSHEQPLVKPQKTIINDSCPR